MSFPIILLWLPPVKYSNVYLPHAAYFLSKAAICTPSVAISPAGSTTAGETYSLTCLATLAPSDPPLPDPNIPSPIFEWFFGPNGNAPLPSGVTPTDTILSSDTYTSTLHFSPLNQSHTGNYTCRLGAVSLNSAMITVNGIADISSV